MTVPTFVPFTLTVLPAVMPADNATPPLVLKARTSCAETSPREIATCRYPPLNVVKSTSVTSASPRASSATAGPFSVNVTLFVSRLMICGVSFVAVTVTVRVAGALTSGPS